MQNRIITGNVAIKDVEDLLKITSDQERLGRIATFNLSQVSLYIDTLHAMQADLDRKINVGVSLITHLVESEYRRFEYGGLNFNVRGNHGTYRLEISPKPNFQMMSAVLLELQQHKRHLESQITLKGQLIQSNVMDHILKSSMHSNKPSTLSLDDAEMSEAKESSTSDAASVREAINTARDTVAFEALESYNQLFEQHRKLNDTYQALKTRESTQASLLEVMKIKHVELQKEHGQIRTQLSRLEEEKNNLSIAGSADHAVIEQQKSELSQLKKQIMQQAPVTDTIKTEELLAILNKFKSHQSLFTPNTTDQTRENLIKLSKLKQDKLSLQQIKDCIKDEVVMSIFNSPYQYHANLTTAGCMVRELAFAFRNPDVKPESLLRKPS